MDQELVIQRLQQSGGIPIICSPITGVTEEQILEECEIVFESGAELVEWRVDFFEHALHIETVLETLPKVKSRLNRLPILFSFRTEEEGGEKSISTMEYLALKKAVIKTGMVQFIDIELFRDEKVVLELVATAKEHHVQTVVSNHDFIRTPSRTDMLSVLKKAIEIGADIPKLAVMPESEEDVLRVMDVNLQLKRENPNQPMIMIAMGKLGVLTRMSGELFGSAITFAAAKQASAPGQLSVHQLKNILQLLHEAK